MAKTKVKEGINIWSGAEGLGAALTNPTELAFSKGKLKNHYPVEFRSETFPDAEAAYQKFKARKIVEDTALMLEIIEAKLRQHPRLLNDIKKNGGTDWLKKCSHIVGVKNSRWEGNGTKSRFILVLSVAYSNCTET